MAILGVSKPWLTLILSRSRQTPFQPRDHVQQRRRESVDLFIPLVESVPHIDVCRKIPRHPVIDIDGSAGKSGVPEESAERPKVGLHVERPAARITGDIRIHPPVTNGSEKRAGMLWPPHQRLPGVIVLLHQPGSAFE